MGKGKTNVKHPDINVKTEIVPKSPIRKNVRKQRKKKMPGRNEIDIRFNEILVSLLFANQLCLTSIVNYNFCYVGFGYLIFEYVYNIYNQTFYNFLINLFEFST